MKNGVLVYPRVRKIYEVGRVVRGSTCKTNGEPSGMALLEWAVNACVSARFGRQDLRDSRSDPCTLQAWKDL